MTDGDESVTTVNFTLGKSAVAALSSQSVESFYRTNWSVNVAGQVAEMDRIRIKGSRGAEGGKGRGKWRQIERKKGVREASERGRGERVNVAVYMREMKGKKRCERREWRSGRSAGYFLSDDRS